MVGELHKQHAVLLSVLIALPYCSLTFLQHVKFYCSVYRLGLLFFVPLHFFKFSVIWWYPISIFLIPADSNYRQPQ